MAKHLPIYASRSQQVIAYALVDDDDYERVAAYRWLMQGEPSAPGFVYRYRSRSEREAHERQDVSLAQALLCHQGRITFRNGDHLDYRRANLISRDERQAGINTALRIWPRRLQQGSAAAMARLSSCRSRRAGRLGLIRSGRSASAAIAGACKPGVSMRLHCGASASQAAAPS